MNVHGWNSSWDDFAADLADSSDFPSEVFEGIPSHHLFDEYYFPEITWQYLREELHDSAHCSTRIVAAKNWFSFCFLHPLSCRYLKN